MGSGTQKSSQSGPAVGQQKGASGATSTEIKFGGKPQTFQKKSKAHKINEDFPEIGSVTQQFEGTKSEEQVLSKKDMSSIGAFGSNAVGPRSDKPDYRESRPDQKDTKPDQSEEKKEVSKPVFTSTKKKAIPGGASVEEI